MKCSLLPTAVGCCAYKAKTETTTQHSDQPGLRDQIDLAFSLLKTS